MASCEQLINLLFRAAEFDLRVLVGALEDLVAPAQNVLGFFDLVRQGGAHLVDEIRSRGGPPPRPPRQHAPPLRHHLFEPVDQV
jgi:hypothetical protein